MKTYYQIVITYNKFDYDLDDYVQTRDFGTAYEAREDAEEHKRWLIEEKGMCGRDVDICDVAENHLGDVKIVKANGKECN